MRNTPTLTSFAAFCAFPFFHLIQVVKPTRKSLTSCCKVQSFSDPSSSRSGLATFFLLSALLLVSSEASFAQVSDDARDVWKSMEMELGGSAGSTPTPESLMSEPEEGSECECPIDDPTVDGCDGDGQTACGRSFCTRVTRAIDGEEFARAEIFACAYGVKESCSCDPNAFDPPLPSDWTTTCERSESVQCGSFKCQAFNQAGTLVPTLKAPNCGS